MLSQMAKQQRNHMHWCAAPLLLLLLLLPPTQVCNRHPVLSLLRQLSALLKLPQRYLVVNATPRQP
jgi:hypothetical protein